MKNGSKPQILPVTKPSERQMLFFLSRKSILIDNLQEFFTKMYQLFAVTDAVAYTNFRSQRHQKSNVGQFYTVIRPLVILGNCIGMMPLKKFYSKEALLIKFSWKSFQFYYSICVQIAIFILLATSFCKQVIYEVEYYKLSMLYLLTSLTCC